MRPYENINEHIVYSDSNQKHHKHSQSHTNLRITAYAPFAERTTRTSSHDHEYLATICHMPHRTVCLYSGTRLSSSIYGSRTCHGSMVTRGCDRVLAGARTRKAPFVEAHT